MVTRSRLCPRGETVLPSPHPSSLLPQAQVRLFWRQFTSKSSWPPLPPSSLGDMEFWMLKDSSSFRRDLRTSWILWGALGSSWKRRELGGLSGRKTTYKRSKQLCQAFLDGWEQGGAKTATKVWNEPEEPKRLKSSCL